MDTIYELLIAIQIGVGLVVATYLLNTRRVIKAIELCKGRLILLNNNALVNNLKELLRPVYIRIYSAMLASYNLISSRVCGARAKEFKATFALAVFYYQQSKYKEAKELYEKALSITIETGDRQREATCYGNLGATYLSLGEYSKAEEYQNKALVIFKEIGDRKGEAACYRNLGIVYHSLGEYGKAEQYQKKALVIDKEIRDRKGEAACHLNLGCCCSMSR